MSAGRGVIGASRGAVARALAAYRATGADLPLGDPRAAHGVAMEGYFWRVTDRERGRSLIALIGVNRGPEGPWATLGLAGFPGGFLETAAVPGAYAAPRGVGAGCGERFVATESSVRVDLGERARLELHVEDPAPWPSRLLGGSSIFQTVPALNQYWHPWLLGGRADGRAVLGDDEWELDGAQVYAEKNWGREGFPDSWWWGQAHGFEGVGSAGGVADEPDGPGACVAFAGGQVTAGPLRTEVTALVVRLPDGRVLRLGNPGTSPVRADVSDERWLLHGRGLGGWRVDVEAHAPLGAAHVLPVPLPSEGRNTPGALEHLGGALSVEVRRGSRLVWRGTSPIAGLEHGGLARAEAELARRGGDPRPERP